MGRAMKHRFTTEIRQEYLKQGLQPCSKCGQVKPVAEFSRETTPQSSSTGYKCMCKECSKEYRKGEHYRKQVERYNHSDHYKQKVAPKYRATGAHRRNNQKYQLTERGQAVQRAAQRRRRARKKAVGENYTAADERITFTIFGRMCFKCGSTEKLGIDHFYCLNEGHPLTITNAVPLCSRCNSTKETDNPEDFYTKREIRRIHRKFKEAERLKQSNV
jgi:5-methylcytosine-specific restriction endonuclease McrA